MPTATVPTEHDDIAGMLRQGIALQMNGRLAEAESRYRAVLSMAGDNFDALHLLGLVRFQQGRYDDAIDMIRAALGKNPQSAAAHLNLANALQRAGRPEEAVRGCEKALAINPEFVEAHNNLGSALIDLGRLEEAVSHFQRALEIKPDLPEAHNNLGSALTALGRNEQAIASYRRALTIKPQFAEAHNNLGNALCQIGQYDEALSSYRNALTIRPEYAEAQYNLGNTLLALDRHEEAIASIRKAIEIRPQFAEAHNNLGNALAALGRHGEAIGCFERALAIQPKFAAAWNNLGNALSVAARLPEAVSSYRRAMKIEPLRGNSHSMLALLNRRMCDWSGFAEDERSLSMPLDAGAHAPLPFVLLTSVDDPARHLPCARRHLQGLGLDRQPALWKGARYTHEKIRVAYISPDFRDHPVAHLIAELFERHDRGRFEITALSCGPNDGSAMRRRLERAFDRFLDARTMPAREIAREITALEIDVAVDLKGYTDDCRPGVLAHRPAPIQVSYVGYTGTMGAPFIDYVIVDPFVVPVDQQEFYTEKLVHLPECYLPNDGKREIAERTPSRAECGLPEASFVFTCFNNNHKITPDVFEVWMRLLREVPGSVLWLLQDNKWAPDNLRREARARGVAPERLIFAPRIAMPEHLARQRLADLFLDTLPYNAHTTASDALWAGLPVLTCAGRSFAARVAGSLLLAIGLSELITHDLAEYEALALKLAREPGLLAGLRERLARSRLSAPLFDCERYARHLEAAYEEMWRIWQGGEAPRHIAVAQLPAR